ncbi:MAG: division/cell wall cluster transcriptional repressor MraZ [Bacillota bacterium]
MAFMGEYQHQLDEKGRLIIPARLREELGSPFVATRGLDRCLFAFSAAEWSKVEEKLRALPLTQGDARAFVRLMMAGAAPVEVDRAGRILLPPHLRQYANLQKDVYVLGVGNRVEIWDRVTWQEYASKAQSAFEAIAEKIVGLGL